MSDPRSPSPAAGGNPAAEPSEQLRANIFTRFAALGDRARDQREWFVAAVYYEEALRYDPRSAAYWVQFGHALKESGDPVLAEAAYRKALVIEPGNADTHLQLGHVLKTLSQSREALESYAKAHELAPEVEIIRKEFAAHLVQHGHTLKESGDPAHAESAYRAAINLEPNSADTYLQLGHVLKILERSREALESYATAYELDPNLEMIRKELADLAD